MSIDLQETGPQRYFVRCYTDPDEYYVIDKETGQRMRYTHFLHTAIAHACILNGVQYTSAPTEAG